MTMPFLRRVPLLAAACMLFPAALEAAVRLPALLSDHMVLQREMPLRIWGQADPGEKVTVRFRGVERVAAADDQGRWEVFLPPQKAGGPDELTVSGSNEVVLRDVLVGEVWVASGQSNMEWYVRSSTGAKEEIAAAHHPRIRLFKVPFRVAEAPMAGVEAQWRVTSPDTIPEFSAVAYFFGRELHRHLDIPVGLIQAARGGTPAEAWTAREDLLASADLHHYITKWARLFAEYPEASKRYAADLDRWEKAGKVERDRPRAPQGPGSSHVPSGLFNGMIAPLTPFAVRGVIWYQGETNASRGEGRLYRTLFPALIEGWRDRWGIGRFPFLFVQLANYGGLGTGPGTSWPEVREAQLFTVQRVPRTGMAVTIDAGAAADIHPKDKLIVGRRLALAARKVAYGEAVEAAGPVFRSANREGGSIRIWFEPAGVLRARGGGTLRGFVVAGPDKVFEPAEARIDGETVLVSSRGVANPAAVRYAWADDPDGNLENAAGLPASPFRSDDWKEAVIRKAEARPVFGKGGWTAPAVAGLPNVLILGDSISVGYTREVRHLLRGRANVMRPVEPGQDAPANCRSTATGLEELDKWLGATRWNIIHFNFGLHDLAYRNPELKTPGQLDKAKGKVSVAPRNYEQNLGEIVARLKRTGACLVWANTTVVPPGEPGRFEGDERKYNQIAARVMAQHGIPVVDLHSLTAGLGPEMFLGPGNVHFKPEANWLLGEKVAGAIGLVLDRCGGVK